MGKRAHLKLLAAGVALLLAGTACGGGEADGDAANGGTPDGGTTDGDTTDGDTTDGDTTEGSTADGGEGTPRIGMVFDIGGRGDLSFNDASAAGLDRAAADFGLDPEFLEPEGGGANREELLRLLSEQRYDLIFAVGFLFLDAVGAAATDFPDVRYALVGAQLDAPNVASLVFAEEEGSFLAGAAAALTSDAGKIGFIGGVEEPSTQVFQAGFEAGARHVDPDVEIEARYLTQPPDFSGFNDPARGNEIARGMFGNGIDVIYHAAGGTGQGIFEAAQAHSERGGEHVWVIGVDSDQYQTVSDSLKPYVLTSMVKRLDVAVYDTTAAVVEGTFEPGVKLFDLEAGGMELARSGGFIDDIGDRIDELEAAIVAGEIDVPRVP